MKKSGGKLKRMLVHFLVSVLVFQLACPVNVLAEGAVPVVEQNVETSEVLSADTEESAEVEETVEAEEPVEVEETVEAEEPVEVEEPVEAEESAEVEETVEAEEPVEVEETVEAEEPVEVEETVEAEESAEVEETVEAEEPVEVEETVEAEESAEVEVAVEAEEPAEVEEPVEAEESAEVEETVEAEESAEVEETVEAEESAEVEETVEAEESVEVEETVEAEEPVEVEETVEAEEPVEVEETVEAEESAEVEETVEAEEPAEVEETVEAEEPVEVEETVEAEESAEVEETVEAEESAEVEETVEAEESAEVEETVEAEESAEVEETVEAEETVEVEETVETKESVETDETMEAIEEEVTEIVISDENIDMLATQTGVPEFEVIDKNGVITIDHIVLNGATELVIPAKLEYQGELVDVKNVEAVTGYYLIRSVEDRKALTKITVEEGIESIGKIEYCESLKEVVLPNSLTTIGDNAFYGATSLESIQLPNSVTSIGEAAFKGCTALKTIDFSDSLVTIGREAFVGTQLTEVSIPASVKEIKNKAFYQLGSLTKLEFSENNKGIVLGSSVFEGCTGIQELRFPVTDYEFKIGAYAFSGCTGAKVLEIVKAPVQEGEKNNRAYISRLAFYNCTGLANADVVFETSVLFDSGSLYGLTVKSVTVKSVVDSYADSFDEFVNTSKTYYVWADAWGKDFFDNRDGHEMIRETSGAKVVFCGELSYLDSYAYRWGKNEVAEFALGEGTEGEPYEVIDGVLFKKTAEGREAIWIPQGKELVDGTYTLPEGTTDATQLFFCAERNSSNPVPNYLVKKLVLPESMTTINDVIKKLSTTLTVVLPSGEDKTYTVESITEKNNRGSVKVELPHSLDNYVISSDSLAGVATIYIPKELTEFPADIVNGSAQYSLIYLIVEEGNTAFKVVDGAIYSADGSILYWYPLVSMKKGGIIEIPEGVKTIKTGALDFSQRSNLWEYANRNGYPFTVILPSTLEEIEDYGLIDGHSSSELVVDASKCIDKLKVGAYTKNTSETKNIAAIYIGNSTKYTTEDNQFIDAGWKVTEYIATNTTQVVLNVKMLQEDNATTVPAPRGSYKINIYDAETEALLTTAIRYNDDESIDVFVQSDDTYKFELIPVDSKTFNTEIKDDVEIKVGAKAEIEVVITRKPEIEVLNTTDVNGYVFDASGKLVRNLKAYQNGLLSEYGLDSGEYKVLLYKGDSEFMKQNSLSEYEIFGLKNNEHFVLVDVTITDKRVTISCPDVPNVSEANGWLLDGKYGFYADMNYNKGYVNLCVDYKIDTAKLTADQNKISVTLPTGADYIADSAYVKVNGIRTKCEAVSDGTIITFTLGELHEEGILSFSVKTVENMTGVSHAYMGDIKSNYIGTVEFAYERLVIRGTRKVAEKSYVVTGIAPANQKLTITIGNKQVVEVTANSRGIWSCAIDLPNPKDGENFVVAASYTKGNVIAWAYVNLVHDENAVTISSINYSYGQYNGTVNMETLEGQTSITTTSKAYDYQCVFHMLNDADIDSMYASFGYGKENIIIPISKTSEEGVWKLNEVVGQSGLPELMNIKVVVNGEEILLLSVCIKWIIDPSGYVYEAVPSNRVEGATATIYYKSSGSEVKWNAEEYAQINPQITGANGFYAWDVPYGTWKVKVEKEGYNTGESAWLPVPPPQLDVNIEIKPKDKAKVANVELSKDSMKVTFSQYVKVATVTPERLTLSDGTNSIAISKVEAKNVEQYLVYGKEQDIAKEYIVYFEQSLLADNQKTYTLTTIHGIASYLSQYAAVCEMTDLKVAGFVNDIVVDELLLGCVGKTYQYTVEADVTDDAKGRKITVTLGDDSIAKVTEVSAIGSDGKVVVKLEGLKRGLTDITFGVEGSALTRNAEVYVADNEATVSNLSKANDMEIPKEPIPPIAVPAKPYKIANVVKGIHVYWKATENAVKYGVWRSETGKNGTYKWLGNPKTTDFTDTKVESGKTYFYKITTVNAAGKHSEKSEAMGITYVGTPDITGRVNKAAGIELGWNKITGATGYAVYRKSYAGTDAWVRVATISGNSTFKWTDTTVKDKNGTVYRYTVRALAGSDRKTLSGCRTTGRTMARLTSRTLSSAVKISAGTVKCTWDTSSKVTGYEVRFMVGNEVIKIQTIGNYKTGVKTFTGLKTGKTYKIQVRSYKKVEGVGTFYSAWSVAKNVGFL